MLLKYYHHRSKYLRVGIKKILFDNINKLETEILEFTMAYYCYVQSYIREYNILIEGTVNNLSRKKMILISFFFLHYGRNWYGDNIRIYALKYYIEFVLHTVL